MKYIDKADADHLIVALERHYEISEECTGGLYYGITINWNSYRDIHNLYVNIYMLIYITKQLQKYQQEISKRPQHSPYPSAPKKDRSVVQEQIKPDESKPLSLKESTTLKKDSAASSTLQDPFMPPFSWHYQH